MNNATTTTQHTEEAPRIETAASRYELQQGNIEILIEELKRKLTAHAAKFERDEKNSYGYVGDLAYITEQLENITDGFMTKY